VADGRQCVDEIHHAQTYNKPNTQESGWPQNVDHSAASSNMLWFVQ